MRIIIKKATVCLILVLSLLVFFASCVSKYISNMVNTPMFINAGEFQATIVATGADFNAQLGYAISDHIAVMINGDFANQDEDENDNFRKLYFIEGGLGYYNLFSSCGHYEVFGGYGIGEVDIIYRNNGFINFRPEGSVDNSYSRYFFQSGVGFTKKVFEGNFSTRFVSVQLKPGERILTESWNYLLESTINARIGYRFVKGVFQIGYSFPLNGGLAKEVRFDDYDMGYDHVNRLFFNFGLNFNISRNNH